MLQALVDLGEQMETPALARAGEVLQLSGDSRGQRFLQAAQRGAEPGRSWASVALERQPLQEGQSLPATLLEELSSTPHVLSVPETLGPDSTPDERRR